VNLPRASPAKKQNRLVERRNQRISPPAAALTAVQEFSAALGWSVWSSGGAGTTFGLLFDLL
jgi:hypothetical protein